jgi:transitional endoplasmic reticulum ATPase
MRMHRNNKARSYSRLRSAVRSESGEQLRVLDVLAAIYDATRRRAPDASAIVSCFVTAQRQLGLPDHALPAAARQDGDSPLTAAEWARVGEAIKTRRARLTRSTSFLDTWLASLSQLLMLDKAEVSVLGIAITYGHNGPIQRLWDDLSSNRGRLPLLRADAEIFSLMLGIPEGQVRSCLAATGRLRESGILVVDDDGGITLLRRLSMLLTPRLPLAGDIRNLLLNPPRPPELPWKAFQHLGEQAETAARVLAAAVSTREPGVGILLYGPPGTGKTTFAAALAARAGATLYPVGESDSDGEEPSRGERLAELRLNQRLLGEGPSVLLFDEAEDLFTSSPFLERQTHSRVFLHRMLEQGRTPVIWTANDIDILGPTVARRMMICIEVRQPSVAVRTDLWHDIAKSENVVLTKADASDLARSIPAAPAILRNALRATRLAGGNSNTARLIATGIARAVAGGFLSLPEPSAEADYDASLVQADCDLPALVRRLTQPEIPGSISLLLSGPPGSGKSAFARHLAAEMGLSILQKRASDLLGSYVGESEHRIASAFAEARDLGAFLVIDEADSLLADRRHANHSWEVSQVNEMLTWMENHPLPLVCTTNLIERLDVASMRRFLIKARFDYLTIKQTHLAFSWFFGLDAPVALRKLEQLTPADFSLVRRRASLVGDLSDANMLVNLLAAESSGREGRRKIGFAA